MPEECASLAGIGKTLQLAAPGEPNPKRRSYSVKVGDRNAVR
jgi:hypothetical protein